LCRLSATPRDFPLPDVAYFQPRIIRDQVKRRDRFSAQVGRESAKMSYHTLLSTRSHSIKGFKTATFPERESGV
jgi:hypothetical protein